MHVQRTSSFHTLFLAAFILSAPVAGAASTIGLYTDASGSSCSFSGNAQGVVTTYVVVKPDANGIRGMRFSAPVPSCFGGVFLTDTPPNGALTIGDSQTGISIAFSNCAFEPSLALQIQYMRTGSTDSCCEFTIQPDPFVGTIEGTDCNYASASMTPVTSHFNADASCPCNDLTPPLPPQNPMPADGLSAVSVFTGFSWSPSPYDTDIASYDLYLGTTSTPGFIATLTTPFYQPPQPLNELTPYFWQVVVRDVDGHTTTGPLWTFTTREVNSPPDAPVVLNPPSLGTNIPVQPTLQWLCNDVDNDPLTFDVYLGIAPNLQALATGISAKSFDITTPLAYQTEYSWYVVAHDPTHVTTGSTWTFTTRVSNYPPGIATNPSPANGANNIGTNGSLSWTGNDVDPGDVLTYDVYFGTTDPPPLLQAGVPTNSYTVPNLDYAVHYYWRIDTWDDHGGHSQGLLWSFTTRSSNSPPAIPSSPSPGNGALNIPQNITMTWVCSDGDGDPVTYDVYMGKNDPPPLVQSNISVKSYTPPQLDLGWFYYWKIVARDSHGAETEGPLWHFTVVNNHPPAIPGSPSPPNGATDQPLVVQLSWTCSDPDPGQTLTYDIYFGTSNPPPLVDGALTSPTWTTPTLDLSQIYFWRVLARDSYLATVVGPTWWFSTGQAVNGGPSDPYPPDGSYVTGNAITLQWSAPQQFTSFVVYLGSPSPVPIGGTSSHSLDYGPLELDQLYIWYVLASDGVSVVAGPVWTFHTRSSALPVLFSRFEADVSGTAARVAWNLQSDEAMSTYTIYRRAEGAEQAIPVVTAAVTGTSDSYLDRSVEGGKRYHYQMVVHTAGGDDFRSPEAIVDMPVLELTLGQNHPNPFNPQTTIPYVVPPGGAPVHVRLAIYDTQGRTTRVLVNEDQSGGAREVVWNGTDEGGATVSSGIYFCVLQVGKERRTQKLVLLK